MKNSADLKFDMRTHGDPKNPCVVHIGGSGTSMRGMTPLVEALAEQGLFVIDYNARDVCGTEAFKQCEALVPADKKLMAEVGGLFTGDGGMKIDSDFYAPYNWYDMADDVAAVMDANSVTKASIIGFGPGGTIAQVVMCRMPERVNSAVLCGSSYDTKHEKPVENKALKELMVAAASLTPESSKEERVAKGVPVLMGVFEASEGDPREAVFKKATEDDYDSGWVNKFGPMNPYTLLAWASFQKTHAEHVAKLKENKVPCLVVAGKRDPFVPYQQSEKVAANTGAATLKLHEHGHMLGPASSSPELLAAIADFIKEKS